MKLRLLVWLRDCGASIALLALGAMLFGAPSQVVAPGSAAYLSSSSAALGPSVELAKRRLIRTEIMRVVRSGRGAAERSLSSSDSLLPGSPCDASLPVSTAAPVPLSDEVLGRAVAHLRPGSRAPPLLG